ncbi:MAG: hypothetical protein EXS69_01025 [Candidatus Zambryskibacteria bacterium]|nr:hypothetical protein [Candidatus Zambryskibacteria bacterium]
MDHEIKSRIDALNETLDSRTRYKNPSDIRSDVKMGDTVDVEEKWHSPELNEILTHEHVPEPLNPAMKKFFIFSILFFVATLLVAAFVFLGGSNFISSKNVDINVVGPTTASAGGVIELGITVENKNNTDLEFANLSAQYPQDSRDPQDSSKGLSFIKYDLGVVEAGEEVSHSIRTILLGSTGEVKEIKFSIEYKVRGSNATFYKDKIYEVIIGEAPLLLSIKSLSKVTSGESFVTEVNVVLNSTETLKNVMLRAEYPYGYSTESLEPQALGESNVWALGDLAPGATKKISIRGRLVGENQDERTFRFYLGVAEIDGATPNFRTVLVSSQETITIERPSIFLNISFNGETVPTYLAPAGQNINTSIRFQNNLPEKLINPKLEVRLSGTALNNATVFTQNNGVYNAVTKHINWNLLNIQALPTLSSGERGDVSFFFASAPELALVGNRDITLQFIFTGTSVTDNKPMTITENRTVKIGSQVTLGSQATRSLGTFSNTGPIPPQVGKDTTYTVLWSVSNTYDDLNDTKVTAKLGSGVKWVGVQSAGDESVSYEPSTNTISWDLGAIPSGLGFSTPPRTAAFQITLTPSASQIGSVPTLVNSIVFSARDTTLGKNITVPSPALTTRISGDPAFIQGDDIVQK